MDPNVVLPLGSSLVSFIFAGLVLAQWRGRRRPFQLVWAVGLLWYGISAGTEFWGSAFGWSDPLYRAWYLIGALYVAAYMGLGTVYLLARTRFGYFAAASIFLGGLFSILAQQRLIREGRPAAWSDGSAIPGHIRVMTGPFNIAGAFALVGGALFSAYVFMPKRKVLRPRLGIPVVRQIAGALAVAVNLLASLPGAFGALARGDLHSRVPATMLIALGGFIPGLTSGLNRFGITWSFFLGEFLGVVLIFAGFVVSTEVFAQRVRVGRWTLLRRGAAAG